MHPASALAKVFFIIYVLLSLVVQFTVISSFLSTSLSLRESGETETYGATVCRGVPRGHHASGRACIVANTLHWTPRI